MVWRSGGRLVDGVGTIIWQYAVHLSLSPSMHAVVQNSGLLGSRKGVNLPNTKVDLPVLTDEDKVRLQGIKISKWLKQVGYTSAVFNIFLRICCGNSQQSGSDPRVQLLQIHVLGFFAAWQTELGKRELARYYRYWFSIVSEISCFATVCIWAILDNSTLTQTS